MRAASLVVALAALTAPGAAGQGAPAPALSSAAVLAPGEAGVPLHKRVWVRPLASLLVPGTGQLLARQPRGVVYLAAEIWLLARAVTLSEDSRRERDQYRSLAYEVARRGSRVDGRVGPFSNYEEMARYVESGAYDVDPGPEFRPESDTSTYNGATWRLARETFFENPDSLPASGSAPMRAALDFYQGRAVTEPFRWSWRDARLEQDVFRASIRASDAAYRAATNYLGAMLLNHLVSAVDAYITTRLGRNVALPHVRPGALPRSAVLEWRASL